VLEWNWDESCDCYRAYDDIAIYIISHEQDLGYKIGFFPGAGPEWQWKNGIPDLDLAKSLAEECVEHVKELRRQWGYEPEPKSQHE
jgi:hypothetical protein